MATVCLHSVYCVCFKIITIWIFEDIIGSKYTSVKAANQIHVCNNTAVTGEVVMIHSFNVSRSISSCSCSVRLPTGADKVPVHYTIPKRERQNCGIKFSLDTNTDFLCEPKSVKRTSLKGIHFSRDRNANAKASLLIKVGRRSRVYVTCGKNISKNFSDHSDDQENQAGEETEDSKEDKGNDLSPHENSADPIHVCDNKTVTGQRVLLHNFNVSRLIRMCTCLVTLPTDIDKVTVRYKIPQQLNACGIKFLLNTITEFLCEGKNVTRTDLSKISFLRNSGSFVKATLQINVEDGSPVTVSCGKKITEYNDSIGEGGSQSGKEEGTNDGADRGLPDPTETLPAKSTSGDNIKKDTGVIIGGSVSAVVVAVIIGGLFYIRRHFRNKVKKEDSADITEETALHPKYSQPGDVSVTTAANGSDAVVTYNAMYNLGLPDTAPSAHHTNENNDLVVTYNALYNGNIPETRIFQGQTGVTLKDKPMRSADSSSKIYYEIKDGEVCASITTANANQMNYEQKDVSAQKCSGKERPSQIYHDINVHEMDISKQNNV